MSLGLYVHIPVCRRKCLYCAFYSVAERRVDMSAYVGAVLQEAESRRREVSEEISTFYVGGGTPSLLPLAEMRRLVDGLKEIYGNLWQPIESTIEVNPDDVDADHAAAWRDMGFNRVSMGVQSFDDKELRTIGRRHDAQSARLALKTLREAGIANISADLIFGLPNQTLESWKSNISELIAFRPEHISAYSLMYEEDTPLLRLLEADRIEETPEDLYLQMFQALIDATAKAGYEHYEISNFSLPGFRACHNSLYWNSSPYVGLGPGAHSFDGVRTRRANHCDIDSYVANPDRCFDSETLTDTERLEERILTELRTSGGLDMRNLEEPERQIIARNAETYIQSGDLKITGDFLRLTPQGIMKSDSIILSLSAF